MISIDRVEKKRMMSEAIDNQAPIAHHSMMLSSDVAAPGH